MQNLHIAEAHTALDIFRFAVFLLYHLKAYLYCFILSHDFKFLDAPFMA